MKHIVFYIMLLYITASCNPCKRLVKLCPPNDSISYIERIDTVTIIVPATTTDIEFPLGSIGLFQETEDQSISVMVRNDTVFIRSTCKQQEAEIYQLRKELASQKTIIERVEIPTYVSKTSRYHSFAGILMPILLLLIIGGAYLKIKKIV